METWGNEGDVRSAAFPLNFALRDAERFNREIDSKNGGDFIVDQRLATTLTDWYESEGRDASAFRNSVQWATHFNLIGDIDAAQDLIQQFPDVPQAAGDTDRRKNPDLATEFQEMEKSCRSCRRLRLGVKRLVSERLESDWCVGTGRCRVT